jgi:hypothetical protein
MAGYDNIKDHGFDKLTAEERRALAVRAGQASGAARRRKRSVKELFQAIGNLPVNDTKIRQQLDKLGIAKEDQTWEMAVAASALVKAMKTDNPKMLEFVLELLNVETDGDGNGYSKTGTDSGTP